ncbi:MAG: DUF1549 and DUF1553 domain-containing protein [Planctomycetes bacterium]|nr:DUF1549 and DUF1553 domain-containing protein [Planctomycetota bacterium]
MHMGISGWFILCLPAFSFAQVPKPVVKPLPEIVSSRDPIPVIAAIDQAWKKALEQAKVAPAAVADDAEFFRRVTLDLTGRIPSGRQALAFLDSRDPDKRRKLVDALLSDPGYAQHFGGVWRLWLDPPEEGGKPRPDMFSPWLAEQLRRNRGFGDLVRELITVEGPVRNNPAMGFVMANSESQRPKPELLADSISRNFMGVELRCAQCHDHPFAVWKQADFWGVAAFFGRLQPSSAKGGPNVTLQESDQPIDGVAAVSKVKGAALVVPVMSGNESGKVVRARVPGGMPLAEDLPMPYRGKFVDWLLARENPYFAKATVNRYWSLMFGRGLVHPLDGFDPKNPPANPEMLDLLAKEFAASDYDLKHLLRCLCLSQAYQRTSRTTVDARTPDKLVSRMTIKPFSPETLYDSLAVIMVPEPGDKNLKPGPNVKPIMKPVHSDKPQATDKPKPMKPASGEKPMATDKPMPMKPMMGDKPGGMRQAQAGALPISRDEFVRFFRTKGGDLLVVNQGILQTLKLLNDESLQGSWPIIDKVSATTVKREEAIETLYLAAYARRPLPAEVDLFNRYLAKQPDARAGYSGMLWILLNSSEFLLNH